MSDTAPRLSVVVCTHNRPADLERCLDALAASTSVLRSSSSTRRPSHRAVSSSSATRSDIPEPRIRLRRPTRALPRPKPRRRRGVGRNRRVPRRRRRAAGATGPGDRRSVRTPTGGRLRRRRVRRRLRGRSGATTVAVGSAAPVRGHHAIRRRPRARPVRARSGRSARTSRFAPRGTRRTTLPENLGRTARRSCPARSSRSSSVASGCGMEDLARAASGRRPHRHRERCRSQLLLAAPLVGRCHARPRRGLTRAQRSPARGRRTRAPRVFTW